jgi:stress-induced-phosphoprotein 1
MGWRLTDGRGWNERMQTYEEGLKHDPENSELQDGIKRCVEMINKGNRGELSEEEMKARQERAMADPEIQEILGDPVMRQVLSDMQVNSACTSPLPYAEPEGES